MGGAVSTDKKDSIYKLVQKAKVERVKEASAHGIASAQEEAMIGEGNDATVEKGWAMEKEGVEEEVQWNLSYPRSAWLTCQLRLHSELCVGDASSPPSTGEGKQQEAKQQEARTNEDEVAKIRSAYAVLAAAADASEEAPPLMTIVPPLMTSAGCALTRKGSLVQEGTKEGVQEGTNVAANEGKSAYCLFFEAKRAEILSGLTPEQAIVKAAELPVIEKGREKGGRGKGGASEITAAWEKEMRKKNSQALYARPDGTQSRCAGKGGWTLHEVNRMCNTVVGTDRNQWAVETGAYTTRMCTMPGMQALAKSAVLIGWPPCLPPDILA
jgi:hypothetical protein